MHSTKNTMPEPLRSAMATLLTARLADMIDLRLQAKHAHWNVRGPHFIALHELFDEIATSLDQLSDTIAERITALGGLAPGLVHGVAERTTLPAYPIAAVSGRQHVEALSDALAVLGGAVRNAIDEADETGDKGTADLFTEVSRDLDKHLWFVEAHLHAQD